MTGQGTDRGRAGDGFASVTHLHPPELHAVHDVRMPLQSCMAWRLASAGGHECAGIVDVHRMVFAASNWQAGAAVSDSVGHQ